MKKLHEKSPCCQGQIRRFGKRRRQCSVCKKTWRVWKKKTGRKKIRTSPDFFNRYLDHRTPSLRGLARQRNLPEWFLKYRLKISRRKFVSKTSWPPLPQDEPLLAIADAAIQFVEGSFYTFYFILIRRVNDDFACPAPPYIRKGSEVAAGWYEAFRLLPEGTESSILALICDGHGGLTSLGKQRHWIVQRCHFHLIARIQSRRSKWKFSRHRAEGKLIYKLVKKVLTIKREKSIPKYLSKIKQLALLPTTSWELKTTLLGFTKHYRDYRSYIYHPELHLPRTTNAIESVIGGIRNICRRAKGFRTLESFTNWTVAFLKAKRKFKCRGQ